MSAPTGSPYDRTDIPAANTYRPGQAVWVCEPSHQLWREGVVERASHTAVAVRYSDPHGRPGATRADTVMAERVMPRDEL